MPTICGLRRRGYTPESIRNFAETVGIAKRENVIELTLLEFCIREHLNKIALRRMVILDPVKVVFEDYPDDREEMLEAENNPEDPAAGARMIPFSKEIFIERGDFMEEAPNKFFRLSPGNEVRLKNAYIIKCTGVKKDPFSGEIKEIRCTFDPDTRSGLEGANRKVKATIHWVSARHALDIEARLYDRLFSKADPDDVEVGKDWKSNLNPGSLSIITAKAEPQLAKDNAQNKFQFLRMGYFCFDKDSKTEKLVLNRTVTLKDDWSKIAGSTKV
jgi:glutaminyl-tRNA synthetase